MPDTEATVDHSRAISGAKRQSGLSTREAGLTAVRVSTIRERLRRFELPRLTSHRDDHEPEVMEPILVLLFLALAVVAGLVGLL